MGSLGETGKSLDDPLPCRFLVTRRSRALRLGASNVPKRDHTTQWFKECAGNLGLDEVLCPLRLYHLQVASAFFEPLRRASPFWVITHVQPWVVPLQFASYV
eukprot:1625738-Pyramimonas_sp.AAC.1